MKVPPFWTDQTPRPEEILTSDFPAKAEVAIIGSGYTGLNAAIVLSEAGATHRRADQKLPFDGDQTPAHGVRSLFGAVPSGCVDVVSGVRLV